MLKFGTGGFRGIIGKEFTRENIIKIGHGMAIYLINNNLKKEVVVSYDLRDKSAESALLISEVLSAYGIKTNLSNDATPTPAAMYMTKKLSLDLGIMITASHNPPSYNGVKIFETGGVDASLETTHSIEELINKNYSKYEKNDSLIFKVDILTKYIDFIKEFVHINNNDINILFDFIYGVGSKSIPPLLTYYGFDNVEYRRIERDSRYYDVLPNPNQWNLKDNKDYLEYDVVMGLDADADRIGVLDDLGNNVDSNEILALIYYYLVKYKGKKGPIVKNITTSNLIDETAKLLGEKCYISDVGFKNVTAKMIEVDALVAGESSGGLTIRDYIKGKDSTLAALLIIEMITEIKKPLSELVKEIRSLTNFDRKIIEKEIFYKDIDDVFAYLKNNKLDIEEDVLEEINYGMNHKFILPSNEWILLRFSGTEPLVRIMAETTTIEKSHKLVNAIMKQLEGL